MSIICSALNGFGTWIDFMNGLHQANDIRSVYTLTRHGGKAICYFLLILSELPPAKERYRRTITVTGELRLKALTTDACRCAAVVYKAAVDQYHRAYRND